MSSGPDWWLRFLRAHKVPNERALFAIGCRESGPDSNCMYPAGAPWGDWKHGNGRHFDTGVLQINDRHCETAAALGYGTDMRWALDPEKALDYALKHLSWSDWGLKLSADGNSYTFDWSGWPSPYRPGESGAVEAEAGFKEWWDAYPRYAATLDGPAPTPTPTPKPAQKPAVSLSGLLAGNSADVRIVQDALNRVHSVRLTLDGKWGPKTQAAYDWFRRADLGLTGTAATGTPGLQSLTALGDRTGAFTVKR